MASSFIAEGLKVIGNLSTEEALQVDGDIEGDVHCIYLILGDKARVTGNIVADDVDVLGHVQGSISGQRVWLKPGAHVEADVQYKTLVIEDGAVFEGRAQRIKAASAKALDDDSQQEGARSSSLQPASTAKSVA